MRLVTVALPGGARRLGLVDGDHVRDLTAVDAATFATFGALVAAAERAGVLPLELVARASEKAPVRWGYGELDQPPAATRPYLAPPLDPVEVWGAGVTYEPSRDARERESHGATIYDRVYHSERPELFFKATGLRVVGPNHPVGLRSDSRWQVPEPELGLVLDSRGRILGYTAGNDMTCRDVEAENPLYLPQAKIFRYSCALGPAVLLAKGDEGPFPIRMQIRRGDRLVFQGETSTSQMKRSPAELVRYLAQNNDIYTPTVLLTGTGIVPPDDFSLMAGDVVCIEVEGVGRLCNPVVQLQ